MTYNDIKSNYHKYYASIHFERIALFECINHHFKVENIIYLGSSIHITPSFIFPNVTYVDNSDLANSFFKTGSSVVSFVNERKKYNVSASISYLETDYQREHFTFNHKFDMALSLFAPNSFYKASQCLKENGILIYLPLPSDEECKNFPHLFAYSGYIMRQKDKYLFHRTSSEFFVTNKSNGKYLKNNKFIDRNIYGVYLNRTISRRTALSKNN